MHSGSRNYRRATASRPETTVSSLNVGLDWGMAVMILETRSRTMPAFGVSKEPGSCFSTACKVSLPPIRSWSKLLPRLSRGLGEAEYALLKVRVRVVRRSGQCGCESGCYRCGRARSIEARCGGRFRVIVVLRVRRGATASRCCCRRYRRKR